MNIRNEVRRILPFLAPPTPEGTIPIRHFRRFLPDNPTIVVAGAHIGIDTLAMSREWPAGTVHAFEPVPALFARLTERTGSAPNVQRYQLALSGESDSAMMFVSEGASDGSSSLMPPKEHLAVHPDVLFKRSIEVHTITLDDWVRRYSVGPVDLLWLDLQGYEFPVLNSSPFTLQSVSAIYAEVSLSESYFGVTLYPEMRQWLRRQGFVVDREELPWTDSGNVLFVREGLASRV